MRVKTILKILFFSLVTSILLVGCSEEKPKPQDAFNTYVSNWEKQDFETMYDMLSTEAKEKITKDAFVERYTNIYEGIEAENLTVTFEMPAEDEEITPNESGEVTFTYDFSVDTLAGPIEFTDEATVVKEEEEEQEQWYINWDPSMIFPEMAEGDVVRPSTLKPKRGEIYDRNGNGLAINGSVLEIGLVPEELGDNEEETKQQIAEALNLSVEQIDDTLNASWVQPHYYVPIEQVPNSQQEIIDELSLLPGVYKKSVAAREYPYGESFAHLIGYVRTVTAEDLEKLEEEGYGANDVVGARGLEELFEERLRGESGGVIYIKTAEDEEKATLAKKEPIDGENIKLTVDAALQKQIFDQYNGDAGTASAIHPITGEILALVSSPAFNPNQFITGWTNEEWDQLQNDPAQPLNNRFYAAFSPGSTMKALTAAIGLDTGAITEDTTIDIDGNSWKKDDSWGNYTVTRVPGPNRPINLRDAVVYSDNIYFAKAALEIGGNQFLEEAKKYGFGETLPIEYPFIESTLTNEASFDGEIQLADSGYGQGQVSVNPLHLGLIYAAFVNNGNIPSPYMLLEEKPEQKYWKENVMKTETAQTILDFLSQVVQNPEGTGNDAAINGIPLAGKTGTAELKMSKEDEEGKENGWFVALDTTNPELLVTMMIEDVKDRGGSHYVTTKVKKVFEQYVKD